MRVTSLKHLQERTIIILDRYCGGDVTVGFLDCLNGSCPFHDPLVCQIFITTRQKFVAVRHAVRQRCQIRIAGLRRLRTLDP